MQVMIEGAGHVPINQLEHHARWQEICLKGRMLYSSLGWETHPKLSRSGICAPPSPTLRGAQMDLGPPSPFRFIYRRPGNAEPSRAPTYIDAKRAERLVLLSERAPLEDLAAGPRTPAELTVNCGMPAVPGSLARLERFGFARRSRQ